jgi:hypothetical protein
VNGTQLNGIGFNGTQLNGKILNGTQLNGASLNGTQLNGTQLNGTSFSATYNQVQITGTDFAGVKFEGELSDGAKIDLSVESITPSGDPDLNLFIVSFDDGFPAPWPHLCGYDAEDNPVPAIPLMGRWNEVNGERIEDNTMFTFACTGYALAKCAEIGYKPWVSKSECQTPTGPCHLISLSVLHHACTRNLRADYCGDGSSHTHDGVLIDLYDNLGVWPREGLPDPTFEAEWSTAGAVCVRNARLNDQAAEDYILGNCPEKWMPNGTDCGGATSAFFPEYGYNATLKTRAMLRNEF